MAPSDQTGGGGGGVDDLDRTDAVEPLTARWLETTQASNRLEFEREMQRHRERFAPEFERFWRRRRHAS